MKQPYLLLIRVWTPECHMWWEMEGIIVPEPFAVLGKPVQSDPLHLAVDSTEAAPLL